MAERNAFFFSNSRLLAQLQNPADPNCALSEPTRCYLDDFFSSVILAIVNENNLIYSETFQGFVLPHCLQLNQGSMDVSSGGGGGHGESGNDSPGQLGQAMVAAYVERCLRLVRPLKRC